MSDVLRVEANDRVIYEWTSISCSAATAGRAAMFLFLYSTFMVNKVRSVNKLRGSRTLVKSFVGYRYTFH